MADKRFEPEPQRGRGLCGKPCARLSICWGLFFFTYKMGTVVATPRVVARPEAGVSVLSIHRPVYSLGKWGLSLLFLLPSSPPAPGRDGRAPTEVRGEGGRVDSRSPVSWSPSRQLHHRLLIQVPGPVSASSPHSAPLLPSQRPPPPRSICVYNLRRAARTPSSARAHARAQTRRLAHSRHTP